MLDTNKPAQASAAPNIANAANTANATNTGAPADVADTVQATATPGNVSQPQPATGIPQYTQAYKTPVAGPQIAMPVAPSAPSIAAALPRHSLAAALVSYPLAYFYLRGLWEGNTFSGWQVPVFALLFVAGTGLLARAARPQCVASKESSFWAVCFLAQSCAMALLGLHADSLGLWQVLVWHLCAVWWVMARTGMLAAGRSGIFSLLDGVAGLFVLPWSGIYLRVLTLWRGGCAGLQHLKTGDKTGDKLGKAHGLATKIVSVAVAVAVCGFAWGNLAAADAHFAAFGAEFAQWLTELFGTGWLGWLVLSIPVGAWLFGLVTKSLQRNAPVWPAPRVWAGLTPLRKLPAFTFYAVAGGLCAVYSLFFAVQLLEFTSACGGVGLSAPTASAFAVDGFWELCHVQLLNFAVLLGFWLLAKAGPGQGKAVRLVGSLLCLFGCAFALLGGGKLAVYISLYGYTPRRILSGWFVGVLLVWAVLAALRQWWKLPAAQIGVLVLAGSFTVLCCLPLEHWMIAGNMARWQQGQDAEPDWKVLEECGFYRDADMPQYTRLLAEKNWFDGRELYEVERLYDYALKYDTDTPQQYTVALNEQTALALTVDDENRCTAAQLRSPTAEELDALAKKERNR